MYNHEKIKKNLDPRGAVYQCDETGGGGTLKYGATEFTFIYSFEEGWEHVSVSTKKRCPTWDEMCFFKDIFWSPDEACIQFHPPKRNYINTHPNCLHIWRPMGIELHLPPSKLV
jgi:hypothetical protein